MIMVLLVLTKKDSEHVVDFDESDGLDAYRKFSDSPLSMVTPKKTYANASKVNRWNPFLNQ